MQNKDKPGTQNQNRSPFIVDNALEHFGQPFSASPRTRGEAQPRRPANARHPQPCQHRASNARAQPARHRPANSQPSSKPAHGLTAPPPLCAARRACFSAASSRERSAPRACQRPHAGSDSGDASSSLKGISRPRKRSSVNTPPQEGITKQEPSPRGFFGQKDPVLEILLIRSRIAAPQRSL